MTLNHLRQQLDKKGNMPNFCLSDFIAPKDNDIQDYMGAFAVFFFFAVLRARWIARGRADAIKLFLDELIILVSASVV
jgi:hypothetical protein